MAGDRWVRVKNILQEALDLEPDQRKSFLDQACGGDDELLEEVASLLKAYGDEPVVTRTIGSEDDDERAPSLLGKRLSHYEVQDVIGRGGMGTVYLALDTKLHRPVALKVLHMDVMRDESRKRRVLREARTAASVQHSNIAAIYDVDETGDCAFIAMEYVRGRALRDLLTDGTPNIRSALAIAARVADALSAVHEAGIVHRDIKPENILLTESGEPKVIDFGLAKRQAPLVENSSSRSSAPCWTTTEALGTVRGTIAYMSPEQAKGEVIDERSDIFSFGVVLYELVVGVPPFARGTAIETLSAILRDAAPPLPARTPDRTELERILAKTLGKDKHARYATMRALAEDLGKLRETEPLWRKRLRVLAPTLALAGAAVAVSLLPWLRSETGGGTAPGPREPVTILIADFDNRTGEAIFDGAFQQALGIGLEETPFVTVFSRAQARERARQIAPEDAGDLDLETARLICRSQDIGVIVSGQATGASSTYEVVLDAQGCGGETIGGASERFDRSQALASADRLATDLRRLLGDTEVRVGETITTTSIDAMVQYDRAQELVASARYREAMEAYEEAIEADPAFGRAYSGLALLHSRQGDLERAETLFRSAFAHMERMSVRERHRTRGAYFLMKQNWQQAASEFEQLVNRYPADAVGRSNLAYARLLARDMNAALEEGITAAEVYPSNAPMKVNVAWYALYAGRLEEAERYALAALDLSPAFEKPRRVLALVRTLQDRDDEAERFYDEIAEIDALGASVASVGRADLAIYRGDLEAALDILDAGVEADRAADRPGSVAYKRSIRAWVLWRMGELERARDEAEEVLQSSQLASDLFRAGRVLARSGDDAKLRAPMALLLESNSPESRAFAHLLEAELKLARGEARRAEESARAALAEVDGWLAHLLLAQVFLERGLLPEAHSELDLCLRRRGEASAVFLDDVPSLRYLAEAEALLRRVESALASG